MIIILVNAYKFNLKKEIGKQNKSCFWRKKEAPKHRYIQILGQNKSEKRKLSKML